ncbi:MAG: type VI secretion system membrane subunit TssM, partial [Spongiibacteraceae bacterium]|nr:type VI secretion system membrane subunit TssM [Spongiibacteraceae bacterium]
MSRLKGFFSNKWTINIIGLIALSILIWLIAAYVRFGHQVEPLSYFYRWLIIAAVWLVWGVWQGATYMAQSKKNTELINDLAQSHSSGHGDDARTKEELETIAQRFQDALNTLRKSRFSIGGRSKSLYQLPWYMLIGPPGAGKTTALVNSGLEFPLAKTHGKEALSGVGGTRNCDWWFTNEAVLIDTAGRYTTQDSHRVIDSAAWTAFLSMLKKYRRRRPINGVIISISLQDLMVQTAEHRINHAKTIRTRINELQQEFGIRFPVYLIFTKCDLVAG